MFGLHTPAISNLDKTGLFAIGWCLQNIYTKLALDRNSHDVSIWRI